MTTATLDTPPAEMTDAQFEKHIGKLGESAKELARKVRADGKKRRAARTEASPGAKTASGAVKYDGQAGADSNSGGSTHHPEAVSRLALSLADVLDDFKSLKYYQTVADGIRGNQVLPRYARDYVRRLVMAKARELAARKSPHGSIRNPPAVFATWMLRLGADAEAGSGE